MKVFIREAISSTEGHLMCHVLAGLTSLCQSQRWGALSYPCSTPQTSQQHFHALCLLRSDSQPDLQCLVHILPRGPVLPLSGLELLAKMLRASIICAFSGFEFQKKLSSTRCCLQPLLQGLKMV